MKIDGYETMSVDLPLVEGYRITGETIDHCQSHLVRVSAGPYTGFGSASPSGGTIGENDQQCIAAMRGPLAELTSAFKITDDPRSWSQQALTLAPDCPAAIAAVDMALWDLVAKRARVPLFRLWGGATNSIPTSVTIGICSVEQTLAEADEWLAKGFFILKVKIGEDLESDVERLAKLREQFGPDVLLRVDANQGYDLDSARDLLRRTADLNIEMFEQPLPQDDLSEAAELTGESTVPIVADESATGIAECFAVVNRRAAHCVNIKLMKCGGPTAARQIHDHAESAGMTLMLGCNDEVRVSIAAGAHLAQSMPALRYADLDGHMDLARDPSSGGFSISDGRIVLSEAPGLGVSIETWETN